MNGRPTSERTGYEVVRTDAVPGTVDRQSNMMFPPSTVYILRKKKTLEDWSRHGLSRPVA